MRLLSNLLFCKRLASSSGSVAALDMGTKNIGVAVSDPSISHALALGSIHRWHRGASMQSVREIITKLNRLLLSKRVSRLSGVVIGLPRLSDGQLTPFCYRIFHMIERMGECCEGLEESSPSLSLTQSTESVGIHPPHIHSQTVCTYWDEYNSTAEAKEYLAQFTTSRRVRMLRKDATAASIILSSFLNHPFVDKNLHCVKKREEKLREEKQKHAESDSDSGSTDPVTSSSNRRRRRRPYSRLSRPLSKRLL